MGLLGGWALRPSQSYFFVLANTSEDQEDLLRVASTYLHRIGFDGAIGYLDGGLNSWTNSGRETASIASLSIEGLADQLRTSDLILVDGREPHEYASEHIEGALSYPLTGLEEADITPLKGKHVAVICPSGFRSTVAASLLARKGITNISVPLGGLKEWKAKGYRMNWRV
jgi:rhodanese-related sulfurtransferase